MLTFICIAATAVISYPEMAPPVPRFEPGTITTDKGAAVGTIANLELQSVECKTSTGKTIRLEVRKPK